MSHGSSRPSFSETAQRLGLFDVVRVRTAPAHSTLAIGEQGTIVEILGDGAFLVDFSGATGSAPHRDDPVHTMTLDQLDLVRSFRSD